MSSAPSGRYQSRLFNFVDRQSRRFKRQCDRAFDQIQATANWAVAVGLSPLLSIFQSNRLSARQMRQAVEQFPQMSDPNCDRQPETPPDVDTPIQRVLLLVNALPSKQETGDKGIRGQGRQGRQGREIQNPLATRHSSLTTQSIRGIATQLSSRALVLVTAQNEILDILTAQQQQQLQQQIIAVIADYWRYQRLAHLRGQGEQGRLEMQGKQKGQEDMETWRHGENPQSKIQNLQSKIYLPLGTDPVLAVLDRAVAEVESGNLVHLSIVAKSVLSLAQSVSQSSLQLTGQLKTQLDVFMSRGTPAMASRGDSETSTNRIQTLIWAAINYFFGGGAKPRLKQSTLNSHLEQSSSGNLAGIPDLPLKKALKSGVVPSLAKQLIGHRPAAKLSSTGLFSAQLPPLPLVYTNIEDPWLTLDDLFGESAIASGSATEQHSKQPRWRGVSPRDKKPNLVPSNQSAKHSLSNFIRSIQKLWLQPKPGSGLVQRQKAAQGKVVEKNNRQQVASLSQSSRPNQASEICGRAGNQSNQMEPKPDWIETHATVMGYVKHPLEQLLAWLDQAMLWLEELCIKVWRWLGQLVVKRL